MENQPGHLLLLPPYHSLLKLPDPTILLVTLYQINPSTSSFPSLSILMLSFANFNCRDHRERDGQSQTLILKVGLAGSERSILGATTGGCSLSHEKFAC